MWIGTNWLPKTMMVIHQNQTSMICAAGVGKPLAKIMFYKIPSGP